MIASTTKPVRNSDLKLCRHITPGRTWRTLGMVFYVIYERHDGSVGVYLYDSYKRAKEAADIISDQIGYTVLRIASTVIHLDK